MPNIQGLEGVGAADLGSPLTGWVYDVNGTGMKAVCLSACLCILASAARATDYFVATNGDDSADGLSVSSPWKSLSNSINRIQGGDRLFVRGGEYRGKISITNNSGSASNYIHIVAYSNETPVLKGSRLVEGWEYYANNIWMKTNWAYESQQVFVEGDPLQQLGWPSRYMSDHACSCWSWIYIPYGYTCNDIDPVIGGIDVGNPLISMTNGTFYYATNSDTLYVRLKDNSSPIGQRVEASTDLGILYDDSVGGYVHVQGLAFRHSSTLPYTLIGWPGVKIGWNGIIEDCDIQWCDASGLIFYSNSKALRCNISNNGMLGISCGAATNFVVAGCVITNNNYRDFTLSNAGGIKMIPDCGGIVESNEVAWNWASGIWFDTCHAGRPIVIRDNFVHDNRPHPNRPGDATSYGSAGIFIEISSDAEIYNNLVLSNCFVGMHFSGSANCRVYNNVISGTRATPGGGRGEAALAVHNPVDGYPVVSNRFFNNLIVDNACDYDVIAVAELGYKAHDNEFDFNCIYRSSGAGSVFPTSRAAFARSGALYPSLDSWSAATGWDTNSFCSDPKLDAQYRLQTSSPCVDAGALRAELPLDRDNRPRPVDGDGDGAAKVDIGAFELVPAGLHTHHVDINSTNPVPPYVNWATAATNIPDAVAVASNGEVVLVAEGRYVLPSPILLSKAVTLQAAARARTILDGGDAVRCVELTHSNALVDGFVVTRGRATAGGGVSCQPGRIQNCLVVSNEAQTGGGIYCADGGRVLNCDIVHNTAENAGGGVYCGDGGSVIGVRILMNTSAARGGGICVEGSGLVEDCAIGTNSAYQNGGGVFLDASAMVRHCAVSGNSATNAGGGIYCDAGGLVRSCVVHDNTAGGNGGGVALVAGGTMENCLASGNASATSGGGIFCSSGGLVQNCSVYGNTAATSGGGVYTMSGGVLNNSIICSNSAPAGSNHNGLGLPASYSFVCATPLPPGEGNITSSPSFFNAGARDFRLRPGSSCIDEGSAVGAPADDLAGRARALDGDADGVPAVDIGAYECDAVHYVNVHSTNPVLPYLDWSTAAQGIQQALDYTLNEEVVLVATGTYSLSSQVVLTKGVTLSSAGASSNTIFDGNGVTRCLYVSHPSAVADGFVLRRGRADAGGGIYIAAGGGLVRDCRIEGSRAYGDAGGAFYYLSGNYPNYCTAGRDSMVHEGGGGVAFVGAGRLENCVILSNSAVYGGGALCLNGGTLQNCTITGNAATNTGGVYCKNGGVVRDTIVYGNTALSSSNCFSGSNSVWSYSCAAPLVGGTGNFEDDPKFVSAAAGNLRLQSNSPCIDTGTSAGAPADDFDGVARPLDGNADTQADFDVGAFEFASSFVDSDFDGLSDAAEAACGTSALVPDSDADGMVDGDEFFAGTNPLDDSSFFKAVLPVVIQSGGFVVRWPSTSNRYYDLAKTTDLMTNFANLETNIPAYPPENSYTDSVPAETRGFYRVKVRQ